jgi:hypothetical protein
MHRADLMLYQSVEDIRITRLNVEGVSLTLAIDKLQSRSVRDGEQFYYHHRPINESTW